MISACVGDGEDTFLEICERVTSGSEWTDILGTYARLPNGDVVKNPPRPLSKNIDKYPMTAWDLMPVVDYHCLTLLKPFATMVTTRGCPWHCGYCSQVYSEKLRFRSVELVVDEMEYLVNNYGIKEIVFLMKHLPSVKKRMRKFAEEVLRRNVKVKFNIRAVLIPLTEKSFAC